MKNKGENKEINRIIKNYEQNEQDMEKAYTRALEK